MQLVLFVNEGHPIIGSFGTHRYRLHSNALGGGLSQGKGLASLRRFRTGSGASTAL